MSDAQLIEPAKYWRLKCAIAELSCVQQAMGEKQRVWRAAMVEAGLDPEAGYSLDDATYSAKLMQPQTPPA